MCKKQFLSPHFQLKEFTESATARKHGIVNVPPPEAVENLRALCIHTLEPLREALQLPVVITSGFRTKALNDLLAHSSERSQHMQGQAADFHVSSAGFKFQDCPSGESAHARENSSKLGSPLAQSQTSGDLKLETGESSLKSETPRQRLIRAFRLIITSEQIDYDQLILYPTFIHVSYVSRARNRRKITTANGQGTYCAVSRVQALALA